MASLFLRARRAAPPPICGQPSSRARTWLDYQLDILGEGRSDAPRISVEQVERIHPWGAPRRSWDLLIEEPRSPSWVPRVAAGLVSLVCGAAAALSDAFFGVIATTVATAGDLVLLTLHVAGIVGADGHLGVVGRLITVAAIVASAIRLGRRLTGRGAAPVGERQ